MEGNDSQKTVALMEEVEKEGKVSKGARELQTEAGMQISDSPPGN